MIDKSLFRHFKAYIGLSLSVAMALLVLQIMDAKACITSAWWQE